MSNLTPTEYEECLAKQRMLTDVALALAERLSNRIADLKAEAVKNYERAVQAEAELQELKATQNKWIYELIGWAEWPVKHFPIRVVSFAKGTPGCKAIYVREYTGNK